MSHTFEKLSGNQAKLTFTIPADQIEEAAQKAYLRLRGRFNVPGFRKGKAPRRVIETMYGNSVFLAEGLDDLLPDLYDGAVKEESLKTVSRPQVDVEGELVRGQDVVCTAVVDTWPEVTLGEYKGLTVEADLQTVTDEMIDRRIAQDQDKVSRTTDVEDRPVQDGDTVNLDYAGTVDGEAFGGGTANNQLLTIGSHRFIPGFEEQLIGMQIGEEKDLNVTFPADYYAEELKGKDAVFHVKINSIQTTEKPELDDDFAQDVSEFDTFAEYRESIVKELQEQIDRNNERILENALVKKASENATVDIPASMVERQMDEYMQEAEMQLAYQGMKLEDYFKYTGMDARFFRESRRREAEQRVLADVVLDAIRKAEGIEPSEEEIDKEIAEQAKRMGRDAEELKSTLTEEQKDYLKDSAAIRLVLTLMKADAKTVPVAKEEKDSAEEAPEEEAPAAEATEEKAPEA